MTKITRIELSPDDPLFHVGVHIFVPAAMPSTAPPPADKAHTESDTDVDVKDAEAGGTSNG